MKNFIDKIEELAAELKSLEPIKKEFQDILDKKFRLEFNFNSNHLEGNTLTYSETELLLIFDRTRGDHTKREYDEMKAHDVALQLIKEWALDKERSLLETDIKNLNEIILVRPFWKDAITFEGQPTRRLIKVGDYKEYPNSVRLSNGEIFEYASVADTPILMKDLMHWYREEEDKKNLHPIELAALLHYKFVCIHPFDDGNGRISRLLMNYVLLKNNLPPIIIKSHDKNNYLGALNKADTGDEMAFINYIAQQEIWSLELSIKAAKGESIKEPNDLDKALFVLEQKLKISGEKITKIKSKETLTDWCSINLPYIAEKFIELSEKFSKFYVSRNFSFKYFVMEEDIDDFGRPNYTHDGDIMEILTQREYSFNLNTIDDIAQKAIYSIPLLLENGEKYTFEFVCDYKTFNTLLDPLNKGSFGYTFKIYISFEIAQYNILGEKSSKRILKLYHQKAAEEELIALLEAEAQQHLIFIQENIDGKKHNIHLEEDDGLPF